MSGPGSFRRGDIIDAPPRAIAWLSEKGSRLIGALDVLNLALGKAAMRLRQVSQSFTVIPWSRLVALSHGGDGRRPAVGHDAA
jgi:hypothetical protein